MINEETLIRGICDEFDSVDTSKLNSIEDVIAVARKYQDIVESHGLVTTHHVNESIEEPDDEDIVSVVTSLETDEGDETDLSFVIHYSKSDEDVYTIFADVDYSDSVEEDLDIVEYDESEEEE